MTEARFVDHSTVRVTRVEGEDLDIARAAWVSTKGERAEDEVDTKRVSGLINMLMRDRHGSPFEQVGFQFMTTTPIFVWREHMRHRIVSYNEQSGRYMKMVGEFYLPSEDRYLVQTGKPGAYVFSPGTSQQIALTRSAIKDVSENAWYCYEEMLENGIAKEVARMVFPINVMSTAYVRLNLRSLMNFLSVRVVDESATFPSYAQHEIDEVGRLYEEAMQEHFPITHAAFVKNGRVAP